ARGAGWPHPSENARCIVGWAGLFSLGGRDRARSARRLRHYRPRRHSLGTRTHPAETDFVTVVSAWPSVANRISATDNPNGASWTAICASTGPTPPSDQDDQDHHGRTRQATGEAFKGRANHARDDGDRDPADGTHMALLLPGDDKDHACEGCDRE